MASVSATTPCPANAASPWIRIGITASRSSSARSCLARVIPSTTGSTASRWDGLDATLTTISFPCRDVCLPVAPRWYFTSPDPCAVSGSIDPSNSRKICPNDLPTTFARTFSRPRCDMPITASRAPASAASASTESRIGMSDSAPSSENRLCPTYF